MTVTTSIDGHERREQRPSRGALIVLGVLAALWLLWIVGYALAPDHNASGQCEGLGFGCTLTPQQFVQFVGVIALAPLTLVVLGVTSIVRFVRVLGGSARTIWDYVVWALFVAAAAYGVLAMVMGSI